jgi:predicted PurR-regulated permease PerM
MSSTRAARRSLLVLLIGTAVLLGMVAWSIAKALFLAAVLAAALWPVQQWCARWCGGRRSLAALLLVFATTVVLVVPLVAFTTVAVRQGTDALLYLSRTLQSEGVTGLVERLPSPLDHVVLDSLGRLADETRTGLGVRVQEQVAAQGGTAAAAVGSAISATGSMLFQGVMMMIALFFLLTDGDRLVAWIDGVSPLDRGRTLELFREVRHVSSSVIVSSLITALVQSAAALVGYLIAGVPRPIFVTGITFVVAFIPAIGAGTVCLAVAGFLWLAGRGSYALFLAIWALVVVSLVDNLLRPYLIKGDIRMHGAVVFFAIIGGPGAFGAIGLLLGPLVVAIFLSALCIYRRDFQA